MSQNDRGHIGAGPVVLGPAELIATALSVVWLLGCGAFLIFASGDAAAPKGALRILMMVAVFLPIALIWVAVSAARSARAMRQEAARLQASIDAMRKTYVNDQQNRAQVVQPSTAVTQKLDEIVEAQRQTDNRLATFTSARSKNKPLRVQPDQQAGDQPALALGTPAEEIAAPLSRDDFIRALNFPDTAEDKDGFAALRRALKDRQTAKLIQASQDMLTLLSQDGIYMDDLRPDLPRTEIWRKFAHGERGTAIAGLGGVRDRSSLALSSGRMRQDPIFRDTAHHFLRRFDQVFAEFEKDASDDEILELSDTRTARAFMLLGRVTGTFD